MNFRRQKYSKKEVQLFNILSKVLYLNSYDDKYIYEVSMDVVENGGSIIDKIKSDYPESIKEIEFVTNPYNYIGEADKIITNIVMKKNKIMEENKNE